MYLLRIHSAGFIVLRIAVICKSCSYTLSHIVADIERIGRHYRVCSLRKLIWILAD